VTHPNLLTLARHACRTARPPEPDLVRHLSRCPTCADEVRRLQSVRQLLHLTDAAARPGTDCLDEAQLAALVDGELDAAKRSDAMRHVAQCAHCRIALASVARALADPTLASIRGTTDRPSRWRFLRLAVPTAAAAALLFMWLGPHGVVPRPSHRAPVITALDRPEELSPVGPGGRPDRLRWESVAGADLYRVTLFHADGRVLYELALRDTVATLPDSVSLVPGAKYLWLVEARTGWNRWSSAPLVEFSVGREPGP
jgi:hypothetical protein